MNTYIDLRNIHAEDNQHLSFYLVKDFQDLEYLKF